MVCHSKLPPLNNEIMGMGTLIVSVALFVLNLQGGMSEIESEVRRGIMTVVEAETLIIMMEDIMTEEKVDRTSIQIMTAGMVDLILIQTRLEDTTGTDLLVGMIEIPTEIRAEDRKDVLITIMDIWVAEDTAILIPMGNTEDLGINHQQPTHSQRYINTEHHRISQHLLRTTLNHLPSLSLHLNL